MLADIVLGVAVLALLIYRQLQTRPVNAAGLRIVAILGIIGAVETAAHLGYDALIAHGHGDRNLGGPRWFFTWPSAWAFSARSCSSVRTACSPAALP